jgi:hypothetical protein
VVDRIREQQGLEQQTQDPLAKVVQPNHRQADRIGRAFSETLVHFSISPWAWKRHFISEHERKILAERHAQAEETELRGKQRRKSLYL